MVLQKRLYYGFNGFQEPYMPRGIRSVRGKRSARNNDEQKKMHAFELLATVAGKLLLEEEFPASDNLTGDELKIPIVSNPVKQEKTDEKAHKAEPRDQGSYDNGRLPSKTCHKRVSQKFVPKECSQASNSLTAEPTSVVVKPETSLKSCYGSAIETRKDSTGNSLVTYHRRSCLQRQSPQSAESHVVKIEDEFTASLQIELQNGEDGILTDLLCLEDPLDLDSKTPNLVSSDSSVEVPYCHDNFPGISSFPDHLDDMELVDKDNDENSSRCNQPSTVTSNAFKLQHVGDRRIRKLLASKFWKVGPTLLKDGEFSYIDSEPKSIFRSRKMCYRRQRTQRSSFRRRKLFNQSSVPVHSREIGSEVLSVSSVNSVKEEEISHSAASNGGQKSKFMSENYQVKFSIKSLELPELLIEMPESATVGELKRTVLETLTAILHNRLRVGVIFQGKKVGDDNKTLLQSGIAQGAKLEKLGFSLEPNTSKAPQIPIPNDSCYLEPCDTSKPLTWIPAIPSSDMSVNDGQSVPPRRLETSNNPDNNLNLVPFTNTAWSNTMTEDADALAVIPAVNLKALAVVPTNRKLNRSELVQRRMRRPFSVSEVEALVQAVEKLGTGRWRDVKLRAFDNVNHRTYVDLKDKWKTLVHTAKISPQQRRGEPVPQELLDRVLSAHGYWSQHQAKLQNKQQQQPDQCLLV